MPSKRSPASLDEKAFLSKPATVTLACGRVLEVPRWSARKALRIGALIAEAVADASRSGSSSPPDVLAAVLPIAGEIVCETLNEPAEFLDTISKDDLVAILLVISRQDFINDGWSDLQKKAAALLSQAGSPEL
jgi:hypothetical protein